VITISYLLGVQVIRNGYHITRPAQPVELVSRAALGARLAPATLSTTLSHAYLYQARVSHSYQYITTLPLF